MAWTPHIMACPRDLRPEALAILYRKIPASLRPYLIAEVLDEADQGVVDLSGLRIAVRGSGSAILGDFLDGGGGKGKEASPEAKLSGRIIGAVLTQPLSAKTAAIWVPEVRPSWRRGAIAAALVREALADLRNRGFQLAQAVLDESASVQGSSDLARGGMPRVTELVYMERDTQAPAPSLSPDCPRWQWRSFCEATEEEFRKAMRKTYEGSQDMPELGMIRSIDDIIADHRKTGRFEPSRWQLGQLADDPEATAVLLLAQADVPAPDSWEVIYLGLTPAARGRGLGRAVIARALELAAPCASRLELAVDVRNTPAMRLYEETGFTPIDRRIVHLAVFGQGTTTG